MRKLFNTLSTDPKINPFIYFRISPILISDQVRNETEAFSPSNRKTPHKIDSKMNDLRGTLDDLISTVSSKGAVQRNTVKKVWETN